mgnify:CR=1 FL=1
MTARSKPKRPPRRPGTVGAWRLAAARVPEESHRQLRVIRKSGESMSSLFMRWIQAEYDKYGDVHHGTSEAK